MADVNQAAQQPQAQPQAQPQPQPQQQQQQQQQQQPQPGALTIIPPPSGPTGQQEQQPQLQPTGQDPNANAFPPPQPQSPGGYFPPPQPQSPAGYFPPGAPGQYAYPQPGYYPGAPQQQPMYPYPPQQQAQWGQQPFYGQPPQQQYSYPPQGWQQPPPPPGSVPQQYPPTGPHNPTIPFARPREYSPGFRLGDIDMNYDPTADAAVIQKATDAKEMDINALAQLLPKLTPQRIERLRYILKDPSDLAKSNKLLDEGARRVIHGILLGPKDLDCYILNYALTAAPSRSLMSIGRAEFGRAWILSMVLLDRKDGDVETITARYWEMYKTPLIAAIKSALAKHSSLANLYQNALENIRNPGASEVPEAQRQKVQADIAAEVDKLYAAGVGTFESEMFSLVLANASTERVKDLMETFEQKHKQSLFKFLESKASSTKYAEVREQLLYILRGAKDRDGRDAQLMEDSMKGFGTKDKELTYRLLTLARDRQRLKAVKDAYSNLYPERGGLVKRISGDTSGDQEKLLKAMARSDEIV